VRTCARYNNLYEIIASRYLYLLLETINTEEVRGGILSESYFSRSHVEALNSACHSLGVSKHVRKYLSGPKYFSRPKYDYEVDMVVVGAGVAGIIAAHKFQKRNISLKVLEKTSKIMGCWQAFANPTSHVAVTEATYRLADTSDGRHVEDYPSTAQVWIMVMTFSKIKILIR
jgi:hypothetical protein